MAGNKPVHTVKVGAIQLSVWENAVKTDKGEGVMRSITINKTYKSGDGFKNTTSFKSSDLPLIETGILELMRYFYLKDEVEVKPTSYAEVAEPGFKF